jgi:hypothetical protein
VGKQEVFLKASQFVISAVVFFSKLFLIELRHVFDFDLFIF